MNTPARFESLMWMASPMLAWAQSAPEAPMPKAGPSKRLPARPASATRSRRKRGKSIV